MSQLNQKRVGAMLIGLKGAIATTVIAAKLATQKGVVSGLNLDLPSAVDPDFSHLSLLTFDDLHLAGWDISQQSLKESLYHHQIVPEHIIEEIEDQLDQIDYYPGILINNVPILSSIDPQVRKHEGCFRDLANQLIVDIEDFKQKHQLDRVVIVDLSSTGQIIPLGPEHQDINAFESLLDQNQGAINSNMIYAYAGIRTSCHLVNFTPSLSFDVPALTNMAIEKNVLLCGKDGKTGQTLYKTAIAPIFAQRGLKVTGWYSTNILGNRDGEVLNDPTHRQSKIQTKAGVLGDILGYDQFDHQVHIHYYKPRGDAKEAWDNIDIEGWFGKKMQMKINWLGWDSILAAPLVIDLIRWVDFFEQHGEKGLLPQLASYFKYPLGHSKHHFFNQVLFLKNKVFEYAPPPSHRK